MLEIEKTCLVIVDVQSKLAGLMWDKQRLFDNIEILVKSANILDIPIIWCQQYPEALGETIEQIAAHLKDLLPCDKKSFSCCGNVQFAEKLHAVNRRQILLCGIEAHVCVYQTAMDLLDLDYDVQVVGDAVSSRTQDNKDAALSRIKWEGAAITTTEMALFELLGSAEHDKFREIAKLVK
ncbi:MAG: hydrolase [Planctomycetes bacterium]|nr:hydrolase [Planctomycetota bacterium]